MCEDKIKGDITPTDDVIIEFVDHDEVHKVEESPEKILEKESKVGKEEEESKNKDLEDKLLRLRADFENYRRRVSKEQDDIYLRSQIEMLRAILPFLDNLERAMEGIKGEADKDWVKGLELSIKDFENALKQFGLEEVETEGVLFDPSVHESMGFEEISDKDDGVVTRVIQRGYKLKGKLVRPAKVFINRKG